jgi:hypothetical protein
MCLILYVDYLLICIHSRVYICMSICTYIQVYTNYDDNECSYIFMIMTSFIWVFSFFLYIFCNLKSVIYIIPNFLCTEYCQHVVQKEGLDISFKPYQTVHIYWLWWYWICLKITSFIYRILSACLSEGGAWYKFQALSDCIYVLIMMLINMFYDNILYRILSACLLIGGAWYQSEALYRYRYIYIYIFKNIHI